MVDYPADFGTAPAYHPVEPEVFLWMPPMLIGALALAALAIAALAWSMGRNSAARLPDAAETIWSAIAAAANAALAANTEQTAKALQQEIQNRLGPVLKLADGVARPAKDLDVAIKGKKKPGGDAAGGPLGPGLTVLNNSHVVVNPPADGARPAPPPPPPPPREVDMSAQERADAIRLAVGRFHDHWKDKAARLRDLRAARDALCHTEPPGRAAGHASGHGDSPH